MPESRIDPNRRTPTMASVEGSVADMPFDKLLGFEQFWAKAINAAGRGRESTSMDRTLFVMTTTILILHGNLENSLARIEELERKQSGMAKALASLMAGD